jgi:hypothetical protein
VSDTSLASADVARIAKVPLVNGQLMPIDFDGVQRLATLMHSTGMLPIGCKTLPQAILLTAKGFELGVPFTQISSGLMIVNNRPTVWGDLALALVLRSPECGGVSETVEGDGDNRTARCVVRRVRKLIDGNFGTTDTSRTFSVADAKKAGLWGKSGPWSNYPDRMLQMRARAFAIRDAFADMLGGVGIAEEVQDYETGNRDARRVESHARAAATTSVIDTLPAPTPFAKPDPLVSTLPPELTPSERPAPNDPPPIDHEDQKAFIDSLGFIPATPVRA